MASNASPNFQTVRLAVGRHADPRDGACVAELASMLAGERFSDHPRTACPVVAAFLRGYNDNIDDERRQDLIPLAAELVDSRADAAVTAERVARLSLFGRSLRRFLRRSFDRRYGDPLMRCQAIGCYAARRARRRGELHADTLALVRELLRVAEPAVEEPGDQALHERGRRAVADPRDHDYTELCVAAVARGCAERPAAPAPPAHGPAQRPTL